jgi:class 3 adenylate cyclase/YHS domain-containing protein
MTGELVPSADPDIAPSTFVFADLAGWTALTEAHGDADALRIVTEFATQVRALLPEHRAKEVKTIGDAVMIRVDDPLDAVKLGLDISRRLSAPRSPPVCVGMSTGPALGRDGDWFGATVNLASRVAAEARPGEVVLTDATREALSDHEGFELQGRGRRRLRNIADPVPIYRAVEPGRAELTLDIDPVCRMAVDPAHPAETRRRLGLTRYFCSPECAAAFDDRPRRYIATTPAARAARNGFLINLAVFLVVGVSHLASWLIRGHPGGLPPLLFVFIAWAAVLIIHFRIVRRVL